MSRPSNKNLHKIKYMNVKWKNEKKSIITTEQADQSDFFTDLWVMK